MAFIVGDLVDCETMVMVRELAGGSARRMSTAARTAPGSQRPRAAGYLFNTTIAGIERADVCLLVGTNPRWEAPLVNARLRKRWRQRRLPRRPRSATPFDLTYPVEELGAGAETLAGLLAGGARLRRGAAGGEAADADPGHGRRWRGPTGPRSWPRPRGVAERFGMVREGWNGFNVLHTAAARVGGLDLGLVPGAGGRDVAGILEGAAGGEIEVVFLIGADEIDTGRLGDAFVVYQGHHGDRGATVADVILPGAAYTEKNATYVNTEGRPQRGQARRVPARRRARRTGRSCARSPRSWAAPCRLDTLGQVRGRMAELAPHAGGRSTRSSPRPGAPFGRGGAIDEARLRARRSRTST